MKPLLKKEFFLSESIAEDYHKSFIAWIIGIIVLSIGFVLENDLIMAFGLVYGILATNAMTGFGILADLKATKKSMVVYRSVVDSWYIITMVFFYILLNS